MLMNRIIIFIIISLVIYISIITNPFSHFSCMQAFFLMEKSNIWIDATWQRECKLFKICELIQGSGCVRQNKIFRFYLYL